MTIFELVKIALDELYAEGTAEHGDDLDELIQQGIAYLSSSYGKLTYSERKPVDYKDPATRFAYVFKYTAAHGDYLYKLLRRLRSKLGKPIFANETARISCVGGGPGSDIVGVLKYLGEAVDEPADTLTFYLLDREQAWADTWVELGQSIDSDIAVNTNFQPLDVTDKESWKSQKKFLSADVFTMSYFVSEVYSLDKGGIVSAFWIELFNSAKSGALFVYVDNGHNSFNGYIDGVAKEAGLETVLAEDNFWITPSSSEQASELADFKAKFEHNPKLKTQISWRVFRKP